MNHDDTHSLGPVSRWNVLATLAIIAIVAVSAWLPGCGGDEQDTGTTPPAETRTGGFQSTVPISVPVGPGYTVMDD